MHTEETVTEAGVYVRLRGRSTFTCSYKAYYGGGGVKTRVPIFYVGGMQRRRELLQNYTIVLN